MDIKDKHRSRDALISSAGKFVVFIKGPIIVFGKNYIFSLEKRR